MRVWVDLTNSPHPLVLRPVIERLRADGHEVEITARDFAQTLELARRAGLAPTVLGRHRGGRLTAKAAGLLSRSGALVRWARGRGFELALGHGSNDVTVAAAALRIPSATMFDYEWAQVQHQVNCRLARAVVVPDAIPPGRLRRYGAAGKVASYPGLKEEYYLADFEPSAAVLDELGLDAAEPIVVVRTPPSESLYHRFDNDLFAGVLERLRGGQAVVLPRVAAQRAELVAAGGFIVPEHAIDAQSLIAHADLVVSAGGTMNREAVALGTPVWTTFEGRLGAVDEALIAAGRLRRLARPEQIELRKRDHCARACAARSGRPRPTPVGRRCGSYNPLMRRRLRSAAFPLHRHSLAQLVVDAGLVALAYYLAFWLRFGDQKHGIPDRYQRLLIVTLPWVVIGTVLLLAASRVYQRRWRYVSQRDIELLLRALIVATVLLVSIVAVVHPVVWLSDDGALHTAVGLPGGVVAFFFLLALAFLTGARVLARAINDQRLPGLHGRQGERGVLIVGAGQGGRQVCQELSRNPQLGLHPVGFIDDDPLKRRLRIDGLRVRGTTRELPQILDQAEPDEVIIAIPSAPGRLRMDVVRACRERGIPVRTLPTVFELLSGNVNFARHVRDVGVEDVLGREQVQMELDRVGRYLEGAVVLVTGAGGSIGSELCRQIARARPRRLVLVDHAEDNMFRILRELEDDWHVHPTLLAPVLADCKEEERMREVLSEHRPAFIFHAAAYKHVGLMERNPVEAVRNNAIGTRVVATVAGQLGLGAFVLVSTDKAVMPATVMGASKALAECAVEVAQRRFPATRYMAVRFGNVLGSSGSVVPIFRRQIAAGGPVTVTDRRMTRYFMTIPEAVALVIRAGSLGSGGEVFVLDMGEPVKILDLARQMIELSGLEPERDIAIEFIGARPGEKLHEDLYNPFERPQPTTVEKIMLAQRDPIDRAQVEAIFDEISLLVLEADVVGLAEKVGQLTALRVQAPIGAESP